MIRGFIAASDQFMFVGDFRQWTIAAQSNIFDWHGPSWSNSEQKDFDGPKLAITHFGLLWIAAPVPPAVSDELGSAPPGDRH